MAPDLAFATPRKLPRARDLRGRVVVLDVAFASEASSGGFAKVTQPLIDGLGERLAAWIDHHDSVEHARYASDPRFVLSSKADHPACPEMITPSLVERVGPVDTIVCHTDFDGLASAAKWLRGGAEAYPGADADARAIDTRLGRAGPAARRIDRALRARPRDRALFGIVVRHLASGLADESLWEPIDRAAAELVAVEERTRKVARRFETIDPGIAFVEIRKDDGAVDKTLLLLLGQERAEVALVVDSDTATVAAAFDSGRDFLALLGLSGGMPTRVSVGRGRAAKLLAALGACRDDVERLLGAE